MRTRMLAIGLTVAVFGGTPCLAQVTAEQLAAAEIRTEKVGDNLYVLFGLGGNIAVSVGTDGVLAVDTQFPDLVPRYLAAIREVGGRDIDFAINTHWHYDHADGNLVLLRVDHEPDFIQVLCSVAHTPRMHQHPAPPIRRPAHTQSARRRTRAATTLGLALRHSKSEEKPRGTKTRR